MNLTARVVPFQALDQRVVEQWEELEEQSIEPNVYLSPHFVIPAVRWLTPGNAPQVVLVESDRSASARRLYGIGFVVPDARSLRLPIAHFKAYRSVHSFAGGVLLDKNCAEAAADQYFKQLLARQPANHGLGLANIRIERPVFQVLSQVANRYNLRWHESQRVERPVLDSSLSPDVSTVVPKSLRKDIQRNQRRLSETGVLNLSVMAGVAANADCIENHLRLENMGWKGKQGTSLLARPNDEHFFREMAARFISARRACFTEVRLDDDVIASTSNFTAGSELFAFKAGWSPRYAKFGLGFVNELCLLDNLATALPDVRRADSGADDSSYMGRIWTHRTVVASGYFAVSGTGRMLLPVLEKVWPT